MRLPTLILFAAITATAQEAPIPLDYRQADLWNHILGPRESIHTDRKKLNALPYQPLFQSVELEVIVSANGQVERVHATKGPKQLCDQAERIESTRTFKPFLYQGTPHRVQIDDSVAILPEERWREPHIPFPTHFDLAATAITFDRTGCYGSCPAYSVTITADGTVRFRGDSFVLIPGQHTARIAPSTVRNILDAFRRADFLSSLAEYRAGVTDMPTQTLTLVLDGIRHTVIDYAGPEVGLPDAIHDLERQVDEAAGTDRWVKGTDLTLPSLKAEAWPFQSTSRDNIALYDSAIQRHDIALTEAMLQAKAPPSTLIPADGRSSPVEPPLCVASAQGDADLVDRMIETTRLRGNLPALPQTVLDDCLAASARSGSLPLVDQWLDLGANPLGLHPDLLGQPTSILAHAIDSGNPAIVDRILRFSVDLNQQIAGHTPLVAYAADRAGRVPHPLADPNQNQDRDQSPEIIALLVHAGASLEAGDDNGRTAIFCVHCTAQTVVALATAGARVDARDAEGKTSLIWNAYDISHVRALLAAGADPTAVAKNGETPLSTAKEFNCSACVIAIEGAIKQQRRQ